MPAPCPVCETVNHESAFECEVCGRQLVSDAQLESAIEPVPGLDAASDREATARALEDAPMEGIELTLQAPVAVGPIAFLDVEPTRLDEVGADGDPLPEGFDAGREGDDGQRTAAPDVSETCPWCGSPSPGRVCDVCGRRKARYTAAPAAPGEDPGEDTQLCPNCYARVPWHERCGECGLPLPPRH
jgi:hypothetical protein